MKATMNKFLAINIIAMMTLSAQVALAEDSQNFTLSTGLDYTTGKYGTNATTDITSVPFVAKYDIDRFSLKVTVPYLTITGTGDVLPGIGRIKKGGLLSNRSTESGWGDIVTAATYTVFEGDQAMPAIDITGKVKFGTADQAKRLGTGENDYSAQVDFYKRFGEFTALASLGYTAYGDTQTTPLDNVFYGSVGGIYKIAPEASLGAVYDYRPSLTSAGAPISELMGYVNYKFTQNWKAQAYISKGFSDGSADYDVGALVSYMY